MLFRSRMKHKLEPRVLGEISTTSDIQMTPPKRQKSEEELKSLLMKVKEESEKTDLKLNIQETKVMTSDPITPWQLEGEKVEAVTDFISLGSKITADGDCRIENKRCLLLGRKSMTNLVQFSSVTELCPTLCHSMDSSTPGLPVIINSQSLSNSCPSSW